MRAILYSRLRESVFNYQRLSELTHSTAGIPFFPITEYSPFPIVEDGPFRHPGFADESLSGVAPLPGK